MSSEAQNPKPFDNLSTLLPEKIRCAHCGALAELEDWDSEPGHLEMPSYLCVGCGWYTEWEITSDGEGGIATSTLYYRHCDKMDHSISWYEARHWPGFWMPGEDGYTVPMDARESEV